MPRPDTPVHSAAAVVRALSDGERRRLAIWRSVVKGSLAIVWICLAAEAALLFVPRAPRGLRIALGAILVESFLTAVVVGAFGRCPACREAFGMPSGRLVPERCAGCGVALR